VDGAVLEVVEGAAAHSGGTVNAVAAGARLIYMSTAYIHEGISGVGAMSRYEQSKRAAEAVVRTAIRTRWWTSYPRTTWLSGPGKVGSFSAIRMVSRRVLVLGWQGVRLDYERRGGAGASTTDRDVA
jgi:hypothetical protein